MIIGIDYFIAILSGMLIMTCLGWSLYFFKDQSPIARTTAWLAMVLGIGYGITSIVQFQGDQLSALACHIVTLDMLVMPLGALLMVMVMQRSQVTPLRVVLNIVPFVVLCPICLIVHQAWYIYMVVGMIALYVLAMIVYIIIRGVRYEHRIKEVYSELSNQSLLWVLVTLVFVTLIVLDFLVFTNMHNTRLQICYTIFAIGAWHLIFGRLMVISRNRATGDSIQIEELMEDEDSEKDASLLISEDVESFTKKLTELMDEQHIFLKPDLNRDELSRQMGMSHTNFTTLLKQTTGLNFYEYINGQRVKYAAQLIDSGKTDITSISNRSGFKYRSTFYRTFTSVYHCTPAEYINQKNK